VVSIQIDVRQPTWHVVLHARGMHIAQAEADAGGARIAAAVSMRVAHGGVVPEELVLSFARPLPAGPATLALTYDAPFSGDLTGLYRVREGDRWYAFTQFEATDARRAFPCFDEPGFKTPFDLALTAPAGATALANMPEAAPGEVSTSAGADLIAHRFQTTPPLPTYLVAFAVGEFDAAEGQAEPVRIRALTTKGKAGMTRFALDAAAGILAKLGDYFGLPYPYPKLDLLAVPDFGPGAMENPGLLTFREPLLLLDEGATVGARRAQAMVIAHEFAHQWFGDLVTMKWWDDIWLSEGFATWASAKAVDAWRPSFGAMLDANASTQQIMDTDALRTSRAVREPVHSSSEAGDFDGIVYDKAAGILRMLESWLDPDTFRRGVQRYLRENAWKNATAADFFAALDFVSASHVAGLADGFLDHPGVPAVLVSWTCGGTAGARLELRASEWRPLGSGADPPRTWTLPVCVASDAAPKRCFTVGTEPIARDLGGRCPGWLYPNAQGAGYYRFVLERAHLLALARAERALGAIERVGLVSNAWAAVRQGAIEPSTLLDVLPAFDGETSRPVIEQIASTLRAFEENLVDDATAETFRGYVAARMAPRKASLGWEAKGAGEDDERVLARRVVLRTMGEVAADPTTLAEAEAYAIRWLANPQAVASDTAEVAVPMASLRAGASRFEELRGAARAAKSPEQRVLAIRAMGMFGNPDVLRSALDLALTDEIRPSELRYVFSSALDRPAAAPIVFEWEKARWEALRARVPGSFGRHLLVAVVSRLCEPHSLADAQAFFTGATADVEGTHRALEEGIERAGLCIALRDAKAGDIAGYFRRK
jgi:aminopeptidase N